MGRVLLLSDPQIWVPLTHITRARSIDLSKQGARPYRLVVVVGTQGQEGASSPLQLYTALVCISSEVQGLFSCVLQLVRVRASFPTLVIMGPTL